MPCLAIADRDIPHALDAKVIGELLDRSLLSRIRAGLVTGLGNVQPHQRKFLEAHSLVPGLLVHSIYLATEVGQLALSKLAIFRS